MVPRNPKAWHLVDKGSPNDPKYSIFQNFLGLHLLILYPTSQWEPMIYNISKDNSRSHSNPIHIEAMVWVHTDQTGIIGAWWWALSSCPPWGFARRVEIHNLACFTFLLVVIDRGKSSQPGPNSDSAGPVIYLMTVEL